MNATAACHSHGTGSLTVAQCVLLRADRFLSTQDARHLAAQQAQVAAARVAREERATRAAQGRRGILRSRGEVTRAELGQRYSEREKCP